MDTKKISGVAGAALLALTAIASAGPMSLMTSKLIAPPQAQTEPAAYRYYHHRRYGCYHHRYRHYGWYHYRYYHR